MVRIWWVFVRSSGGKRWSCYSPRSSDGQETTFLDALLQYTALCSWWGFSTLYYTVVHWWHCPRNWMLGISALTCPAKPLPSFPLPNLSHSDWQHFYPHSVSFSSYLWPLYEKSFERVNILDTLELKELVLLIICCVSYAGKLLKLLSELKAFWHAQCTVHWTHSCLVPYHIVNAIMLFLFWQRQCHANCDLLWVPAHSRHLIKLPRIRL